MCDTAGVNFKLEPDIFIDEVAGHIGKYLRSLARRNFGCENRVRVISFLKAVNSLELF